MPIRFAFSLKPGLWSRSWSLSRSQDLGIFPGAGHCAWSRSST